MVACLDSPLRRRCICRKELCLHCYSLPCLQADCTRTDLPMCATLFALIAAAKG